MRVVFLDAMLDLGGDLSSCSSGGDSASARILRRAASSLRFTALNSSQQASALIITHITSICSIGV